MVYLFFITWQLTAHNLFLSTEERRPVFQSYYYTALVVETVGLPLLLLWTAHIITVLEKERRGLSRHKNTGTFSF